MWVARPVDESVWAICKMMRRSIVSSTIGESKWGSVLLGKNKTVLLSLNVLGANISRQVVQVDHVTSVLGLGSGSDIIFSGRNVCQDLENHSRKV